MVIISNNGDNWCCQTEQGGSKRYENVDPTELKSHRGPPKRHQDTGLTLHGSSTPRGHTEDGDYITTGY